MNKRKTIGILLVLIGIGIIAYPMQFKIRSNIHQRKLKSEFEERKNQALADGRQMNAEETIEYDAWPETLMTIPAIDLEAMVEEMEASDIDVFAADPNYPPAHYRSTAFPGSNDNVAIAAHRIGPADYFRHLDKLEKGDPITLETVKGVHEYEVEEVFTVYPDENHVIAPTDYGALTLTSCEREDGISNKKRIIVRAKLKDDQGKGAD